MVNRIQQPSNPSNWLYKDEETERLFAKQISLPNNMPDWLECTNEEKVQWEEAHKPEESEEPTDEYAYETNT